MIEEYRIIVAGGVVLDENDRVLVIERDVQRQGNWIHEVRLPKGHVDSDESHAECAKREVGEETGYWDVVIIADLGFDLSEFEFNSRHYVRTEHYYLMRTRSEQRGTPKPTGEEEARFTPRWLTLDEAEQLLTYPSERHFVRRAKHRLMMGKVEL